MSRVYDKQGKPLKTYDKDGNEVSVISTIQSTHEWCLQYKETLLAERIAIIEAVAIAGMIVVRIIERTKK